jgi:two-component system nitrate/nitrite response regulator NarL
MKILIFCSNWPFREGIVNFINNQPGFVVIGGEITSETDLIDRTLEIQPDVILLEIDNFEDGDFRSIKRLSHILPSTSVIVLSSEYSEDKVITALSNGAKGFLSKSMSKSNLLSCLQALQKGELLLPRKMVNSVVSGLVEISNNNNHKSNQMLSKLTYRELEVLNCIKNHETNKEIAIKLMISVNTVRIHVHNILKKLNVQNRRDAAKLVSKIENFD